MSLLISALYLCLYIAIIILVAYGIVWLAKQLGFAIDGDVLKWGRIVVLLLIVIAVVIWLSGLVGYMPTFGRLS